ncbi:ParB/RepB/Spo0J family partition protein [Comamonas terrigena]|uniref:Chromosome partitioning protein ParB n=1 Tax=Comamonas terrigena TaxID=32013 RepID=A0A2A7UY39_COMTR|nr:ParB/RepB/Spo0J family partition protein [Comamonas terrigena]PEH90091.1 chromosome partitioning protein ParB [Comamonas terrigena]BBL25383.1 hypothetical protein CT3_28380 [Comamonas terrigena NBRC 13299]SUY71041.1 Probable chromosome-partitioning protein parB [Comamonas terrigena]
MTDAHDTITHAIPAAGAGAGFAHLPVLSIARSLTNPRKHFDPVFLQELADSIKATGVHQPILVRPLPAHRVADEQAWAKTEKRERAQYELIAGEHRWRACQMAGMAEIPAMIRDMTDAEALEAQVIENLQRKDVSELEEAEGFQVLMQHQGISADQMGAKIGKSRAYVYGRLKILDLCEEGRQALREGKLDYSCGLPIARIPNEQLQLKALQRAIAPHGGWNDGGRSRMSAREVQYMCQSEFMTKLEYARFDREDATLCATAGACSTCPNRTGANPDLFTDVDSADVCTNPPCFKAKEEAHAVRVRKQAQDMGCEIIDGRAAKELVPSAYSGGVTGYLRLDSPSDSPVKGKTLRKLTHKALEESGIKPTMVVNPHDEKELIAVVTPNQAEELLKMAGKAEAHKQLLADNERDAKQNEQNQKKQAEETYERDWRTEVARQIAVHTKEPSDACLVTAARMVTQHLATSLNGEYAKELCKMLELGKVAPKDAIRDLANDWAHPIALAGAILALRDKHYSPWYYEHNPSAPRNPELMAMAEACGVDVEAIKAQVKANMRAAAKQSANPAEGDTPLPPAARAGADGKGGKAKKSKNPAARAAEDAEKLSSAAATAGIAAALQSLSGDAAPGAAEAALGDEAVPVAAAAAQAPAPLVTLKRPKPTAPAADTPASGGQQEPAGDAQDSADAKTATAPKQVYTPEELLANRVTVLPNATGRGKKIYIGDEGTVVAIMGDAAVDVSFPGPKGCKPVRVAFHVTELELAE